MVPNGVVSAAMPLEASVMPYGAGQMPNVTMESVTDEHGASNVSNTLREVVPVTLSDPRAGDTKHQDNNVNSTMRRFADDRMNVKGSIMRTIWLAAIIVVSAALQNVTAQELDANVIVNMDALQIDQRQDVQTMANDVRTYLINQRFTGMDWDGPRIPIDVTIYLNGRNGNTYSGRLAIVSRRPKNGDTLNTSPLLRVFDQEWSFVWTFNPTLSFQTMRYDPFTSYIDFYVLLAIGLDMDTYEDQGGNAVYERAKQIAGLGNAAGISSFSTNFQPGELTKMAMITEFTDPRMVGLRRLIYDYHVATDEYTIDPLKGRAEVAAVLKDIADYKQSSISNRSVMLQLFFDAKAGEIADIFRGQKDSPVWNDLRFLDPGNTQMYEQARSGQ